MYDVLWTLKTDEKLKRVLCFPCVDKIHLLLWVDIVACVCAVNIAHS